MKFPKNLNQKGYLTGGLHLITLWGFAVAQPIYDLLGKFPTFLVAHDVDANDMLVFILLSSIIFPVCLVFLGWLLGILGKTIHKVFHYSLIFIFFILSILPILKKIPHISDLLVVCLGIIISGAFVYAYHCSNNLRSMISIGSIAILIFPLYFLFLTPVNKIVIPREEIPQENIVINEEVPIVFIALDEIATTYLLDETERIDSVRYPNFASLADDAYWFRNATTVSHSTNMAIPAMLTGNYYRQEGDSLKLPTFVDYPQNLFTLLDGVYHFNVVETIVKLSPEHLLNDYDNEGKFKTLLLDTSIAYLHIISPETLARKLPDITQNWGGFLSDVETAEDINNQIISNNRSMQSTQISWTEGRVELYREFVELIQSTNVPSLNYIEIVFPHPPFEYLPSGKRYGRFVIEGLNNENWDNDEWLVRVGFQRYLLQLGFMDKLIGELLEKLKTVGLYDKSLIIITADHGVSFHPSDNRRRVNNSNFGDIMPVPLLIKLPFQTEGIINDRRVEIIDILPTIANVIGVDLPWKVDGISVFDPLETARTGATIRGTQDLVFNYSEIDASRRNTLDRMLSWFGSGTSRPNGLYQIGPYEELIGKTIGQDVFSNPSPYIAAIDQQTLFHDIDLQGDFIPTYITGKVFSNEDAELPQEIAIVVNNKINATARVLETGKFVSILPEEGFKQGHNGIEVLAIFPSGDGELQLFHTNGSQEILYFEDNHLIDITTGESYSVYQEAVRGFVDGMKLDRLEEFVEIFGWAVDEKQMQLVDKVIILVDGQSVYLGSTSVDRQDVSKAYQNTQILRSGFRIILPFKILNDSDEIRVFVISNGIASELGYSQAFQRHMPKFQSYQLQQDKIISLIGKQILIEPRKITGWVDTVQNDNQVIISGWAADVVQGRLVDAVVVFVDDESVSAGCTNIPRLGVSEKFENDQLLWSGFRIALPNTSINHAKEVRVFAISNGVASELRYSSNAQEQLPQFQDTISTR
jgi:hypothetical protein